MLENLAIISEPASECSAILSTKSPSSCDLLEVKPLEGRREGVVDLLS